MAVADVKISGAEALVARHPAPASAAKWANEARDGAMARLRAMGAPMRRDEYWRFTNPAILNADAPRHATALVTDETPVFDGFDALRIVFVDGVFDAAQSSDLSGEPHLSVEHLTDALATDIHWAKDVFGVLEAAGQTPVDRPFAALNTAVAQSGVVIRATGPVSRPVNLRYLHVAEDADAVIHHVIKVDDSATLTILENGPAAARFNKAMEIMVGDGAEFHHVRAQGRDHDRQCVSHMFARVGKEALYKSFTLTVNGVLTRNEHVIDMQGDDASAHVAGACVGEGDFHHDDTVFVTHDAERCESRQVFKKVLKSGAVGVFQGKILVKEGAQKTDGYQISQGLLLDDDAQFLAKPELEIYADDVACSHGSTCGAADETALFYLLSRGIPRAQAENMLVLAFLGEAMDEIADDDLAEEMRGRVAGWLERHSK
ncbi:Fe-S cluster assembly protein SufD [Rubricella aquisinus]|uniref:Fe-S cluster assembly protein SufD n=1 Tax=Rubricella aquisinus TaxID=2028108 RepID=A0A840WI66_9RHOB|nr:SufD family Fe-S cluster assembly protein [Rubricella aquisinus]MBB5514818.1 Fe-S cluster assembly protein SufD [Rubricella aquisinus]